MTHYSVGAAFDEILVLITCLLSPLENVGLNNIIVVLRYLLCNKTTSFFGLLSEDVWQHKWLVFVACMLHDRNRYGRTPCCSLFCQLCLSSQLRLNYITLVLFFFPSELSHCFMSYSCRQLPLSGLMSWILWFEILKSNEGFWKMLITRKTISSKYWLCSKWITHAVAVWWNYKCFFPFFHVRMRAITNFLRNLEISHHKT